MMSKKDFCEMTIVNWKKENNMNEINQDDVFHSSGLGIAMDYLGLITDSNIKNYIDTRGGILYIHYNGSEVKQLSFRELLSLLPELTDE